MQRRRNRGLSALMQIARRALHALLPKGPKPRVLRFGLAKGATATIDFRYDTAFYFGLHEPWLHPFYRDILKPGMKCFDVGMYRGWDALCIAVLTRSEVVSFDSDPQFLEVTEQFLAPSDTNIRLECSYISDGQNGSATLDSFADKHFAPDFMKMDIEGGELAALRGASCILTVHKPSLVVETHSVEL